MLLLVLLLLLVALLQLLLRSSGGHLLLRLEAHTAPPRHRASPHDDNRTGAAPRVKH